MKVAIFHGWGASSDDNWFPYLKEELQKKSIEVFCPDLPSSQHPIQSEWMKTALDLTDYDKDTILVGHSLGTILILRLLEKISVRSAYLVAGFDEDLGIDEIKNFFEKEFNYEKIRNNAHITMLSSDNDPYIPVQIAKRLSEKLDSRLIVFKGMDHLSNGTGDRRFPGIKEMIMHDIDKKD